MQRTAVQSSHVQSVGHNGSVLEVQFKNGDTYQYLGVSRTEYSRLLANASTGIALNRIIKRKYKGIKI